MQFRFDLGNGATSLTSPSKVATNEWHKVKVTRHGLHGTIQVDDGPVVEGAADADGALTELNLKLPLYLGGYR